MVTSDETACAVRVVIRSRGSPGAPRRQATTTINLARPSVDRSMKARAAAARRGGHGRTRSEERRSVVRGLGGSLARRYDSVDTLRPELAVRCATTEAMRRDETRRDRASANVPGRTPRRIARIVAALLGLSCVASVSGGTTSAVASLGDSTSTTLSGGVGNSGVAMADPRKQAHHLLGGTRAATVAAHFAGRDRVAVST